MAAQEYFNAYKFEHCRSLMRACGDDPVQAEKLQHTMLMALELDKVADVRIMMRHGITVNMRLEGRRSRQLSVPRSRIPHVGAKDRFGCLLVNFAKSEEMLRVLLEEGDFDPTFTTHDGETPLHCLAREPNAQMAQQFLAAKVDPLHRDVHGRTAWESYLNIHGPEANHPEWRQVMMPITTKSAALN